MSDTAYYSAEKEVQSAVKRVRFSIRAVKLALIVVPILLLVLALLWIADSSGVFAARCEVLELQTAAVADDKDAAGLPGIAKACFERGLEEGDGDAMVAAIAGLRVSAEQAGSAESALLLARLYDPNERESLLAIASSTALIPDANARSAIRYYDLANQNGDIGAKASATLLRKAFRIPDHRMLVGGDALPIVRDDGTGLFRRVLLKPGGKSYSDRVKGDDPEAGEVTRALDIQYVFAETDGWVSIARRSDTAEVDRKWIKVEHTVEWNHMLSLRYREPKGQGRVLFFDNEIAAGRMLSRPELPKIHEYLTTSASADELRDAGVVALQDDSYPWGLSNYVMPITNYREVERDGQILTLVKIASIAGWKNAKVPDQALSLSGADHQKRISKVAIKPEPGGAQCQSNSLMDLRHQVVFLIDTTISMGPYIEGVKRIATRWESEINRRGLQDKFRFGVVAYRNNMDAPPQAGRLEYVRKKFLSPDANATADRFVRAVQQLRPANVSTHEFNEDVAAGLEAALSHNWNSECGLRLIYLITDAGALAENDPKAMLFKRSISLFNLSERAKSNNVRLNVVHLQTPEARAAGNAGSAAETYRSLLGNDRYTFIRDGNRSAFDQYLDGVGGVIEQIAKEATGTGVAANATSNNPSLPSEMILNDLFAVQQTFIGQLAGSEVPVFVDLWTSDRDLADLDDTVLEIGVMLTRNQLSALAEQLSELVAGVDAETRDSASFFKMLQIISAGTSSDPIAVTVQGASEAELGQRLPSWLKGLPYRSQVLSIDETDWRSMSDIRKSELVFRLKEKLNNYQDRERESSKWIRFDDRSGGSEITFIPLSWMP